MLMYFYAFEQVLIPNVQFFLKKNLLRLFFTIKKVMGLLDKERKKSAISKSDWVDKYIIDKKESEQHGSEVKKRAILYRMNLQDV